MPNPVALILALTSAVLAAPAVVQAADPHAGHHAMPVANKEAADAQSEGTVKKIDASAGKITIAHGPLKNLGMPAMTMVFKVKDAAQMKGLKVGDAIRFTAEKAGNEYLATQVQAKK